MRSAVPSRPPTVGVKSLHPRPAEAAPEEGDVAPGARATMPERNRTSRSRVSATSGSQAELVK